GAARVKAVAAGLRLRRLRPWPDRLRGRYTVMRATHSADRVLDHFLSRLLPELARRAVGQCFVRVNVVVMRERGMELTQHAGRVGLGTHPRVVPFDGFDEGFSHAVRLGALDRRRAWHQADVSGQGTGVPGDVGRAVVRQPFDRLGQFVDQPEAALDAFDHQIADVGAANAAGGRHPGDRLAVAAVQCEGDAHLLAIVAAYLEPVRAPSRVGAVDRDAAIMPAFLPATGMSLEQQTVRLHDAIDPLHVHCRAALFATLTPEQRVDAAVAVGGLTGN